MKDVRRFETNELFGIKARDWRVRTGTKVAVLGSFSIYGSARPGFRVYFMSSEGVGGTAQAVRFDNINDAQRWIHERGIYDHREEDMSVVKTRAAEFVRVPLCDFDADAWVNSCILNRWSESVINAMREHCPEYIEDNNTVDTTSQHQYRGFRF